MAHNAPGPCRHRALGLPRVDRPNHIAREPSDGIESGGKLASLYDTKLDMNSAEELPGGNGAYELQMKLRTTTVRLLRKKMFDKAIHVLEDGAQRLLDMKEEGSACDITEHLLDVYTQADVKMDDENRKRIISILSRTTSPTWRRKSIAAASKWAVKATGNSLGDPQLNALLSKLLTQGTSAILVNNRQSMVRGREAFDRGCGIR